MEKEKYSILESLTAICGKGDKNYFRYVNCFRQINLALSDKRKLSSFLEEIKSMIAEQQTATKPVRSEIFENAISYKDTPRRFNKLLEEINTPNTRQFLTGDNFDECLEQYLKIINYVEITWAKSTDQYKSKNYSLASFLSILVIEEVGKLRMLWYDLVNYDLPKPENFSVGQQLLNHKKKHLIGMFSGALINSRVDRILGKKCVRKALEDAESGRLEKFRQACLYLDFEHGKMLSPYDRIDESKARFFTVIAGEIMAEVLGHFPWEFYRMIDAVIEYEKYIGFDPEIVRC